MFLKRDKLDMLLFCIILKQVSLLFIFICSIYFRTIHIKIKRQLGIKLDIAAPVIGSVSVNPSFQRISPNDHRNPVNDANMKADPFIELANIVFRANEGIESLTLVIYIPMIIIIPPDISRAEIDSFRKIIPTTAVVKIKTLVAIVIV